MTQPRQTPPNPFTLMLEWQTAAMRLWWDAMLRGTHACEAEAKLPRPEPQRRSHDESPRGARLDDHYGRRDHDVDVEHL